MKEIKAIDPVYIDEFDIYVNPYLTYDQIQQIVNAVIKFDTWAEREQNIDLLVLYHATDIGKEKIEELGHDVLLQSGLISAVNKQVMNLYSIHEAIEYTESTVRALAQIVKMLPEKMKDIEKVIQRGANKK